MGRKKPRRNLVDQIVARLSREYQSDEKLQRIIEIESEFGIRMGLFQPSDDFFPPEFLPGGFGAGLGHGVHFVIWESMLADDRLSKEGEFENGIEGN